MVIGEEERLDRAQSRMVLDQYADEIINNFENDTEDVEIGDEEEDDEEEDDDEEEFVPQDVIISARVNRDEIEDD